MCSSNQLASLEYAPREIGGTFWCHCNRLTSLRYLPQTTNGYLYCWSNPLKSLEHAPQNFKHLVCDFGAFDDWLKIPPHLHVAPPVTEMPVKYPRKFNL